MSSAPPMNEAQVRFLASMMKNNRAKLDVDWDAVVAEIGGLTVKSARERYRVMAIKFKFNKEGGGGGGGGSGHGSSTTTNDNDDAEYTEGPNVASSPATPRKARGGGVAKNKGRIGDSAKKARGRKKTIVKNEQNGGEEEALGVATGNGDNGGNGDNASKMKKEDADADVFGEA
ncbi:hypothetical protein BD289DRAFT_487126 [Coniella lustricola]|uniref:Myb-like DNA-binding domain-containing protein n=1 Tax=Coniella lustricola TaxID=2025994 RepID=A0A2T2ZSU1_9PEZI|nr:hypothetical protein BD289DRAFT_487126 [Coniella lustricola]